MSPERADVRSIDAIDRFRVDLIGFIDTGKSVLSEAESDIEKTIVWLQRDRVSHWTMQIRKRQELVSRAKSELYRKQVQTSSKDSRPSVVDEKRALRRAELRFEEAQKRMKATKRWVRALERELALYKGNVSSFSAAIDRELPHAVALLKKMTENLEKYLALSPPDLLRLLDVKSKTSDEQVAKMRRTGEDATTEPPDQEEPS